MTQTSIPTRTNTRNLRLRRLYMAVTLGFALDTQEVADELYAGELAKARTDLKALGSLVHGEDVNGEAQARKRGEYKTLVWQLMHNVQDGQSTIEQALAEFDSTFPTNEFPVTPAAPEAATPSEEDTMATEAPEKPADTKAKSADKPKEPKAPRVKKAPLTLSQRKHLLVLSKARKPVVPETTMGRKPYEHFVAHGLATSTEVEVKIGEGDKAKTEKRPAFTITDAGKARAKDVNTKYAA